jgi:PEP-CTERM motif
MQRVCHLFHLYHPSHLSRANFLVMRLRARFFAAPLLLLGSLAAQAQGTWAYTACHVGAVAPSYAAPVVAQTANPSAAPTVPSAVAAAAPTQPPRPCKATPAWGNTGVDYVLQALAMADTASLGAVETADSVAPASEPAAPLADGEALLVSFTHKAHLASVALGYLDTNSKLSSYRWDGPLGSEIRLAVAGEGGGPALSGWALVSNTGAGAGPTGARLSSWWLLSAYSGLGAAGGLAGVGASGGLEGWAADSFKQLSFLATTCPQIEGQAAAGSGARCTAAVAQVPEPSTWALVGLALIVMAGLCFRRRSR